VAESELLCTTCGVLHGPLPTMLERGLSPGASHGLLRLGWQRRVGSVLAAVAALAMLFVALRTTGTLGPRAHRWTLQVGSC
jgi:hypothetical protein